MSGPEEPVGAGSLPTRPRPSARKILLVMLGAIVVLLVAMVTIVLPRLRERQERSWTEEARTQLYTLCSNVAALHEETGHWISAGPQPREIPRRAQVDFPKDPGFERLQFDPGRVRYQYQVVVDGNPEGAAKVRCVARGDLNGNGVPSEATLELDPEGMLRPVKWKDQFE